MSEISEFFPVTAGLVIGLVVLRIANVRLRTVALIALSVLAGFLASLISAPILPGLLLWTIKVAADRAPVTTGHATSFDSSRHGPCSPSARRK